MSKKTRKKSSKTMARSSPAKAPRGKAVASVKPPAAKARKAVAKKSSKAAKAAPAEASHKATSKSLKSAASAMAKATAPVEGAKEGAKEGTKAPTFNLPRDGGGQVSLADFAGKKLVLFFYPRADTPGCTREAIDFTRLKGEFADAGTEVLGISADTVKAQEAFRDKHQLAVPLVSDPRHEMLEAYGAWGEKSMYGKTFLGILRTTVLIDSGGRIARIWRKVRVDGHAAEVLAAARSL